jgi:hypothetical protein
MFSKRKDTKQAAPAQPESAETALLRAHVTELQRLGDPAYFAYRLELEMARARRYTRPLSIITLTFLPPRGSKTVSIRSDRLAAALRGLCRPSDIMGLADQHSIGVILPETSQIDLLSPSNRLYSTANTLVTSMAPDCTVSIGSTTLSPAHQTAADMISDARYKQVVG